MSAATPVTAYIALGANIGDPRRQLADARNAIAALPGTRLSASSALYRTPPVGPVAQPDFLNAAVAVETSLAPRVLLQHLHAIERAAGRIRGERWGPRTLDLDLLLHEGHRSDTPDLQLPHPRLWARAFVLLPLADIAPQLRTPSGDTLDTLLGRLDRAGIERIAESAGGNW